MSDRVPVYRPSERIQRQPLVDVSTGEGGAMAALSRAMGDLQNTFAAAGRSVAEGEQERRFGEARRDALTAPIRDEAGNYTAPEPDFTTRTGRMSAETLLGRIIDEETIGARERAVRMRADVGGDPERFSAQWRADSDQRITMLPAWVRERAGQVFRQIGIEHVNSQRMDVVRRDQRLTEAGWRDVLGAVNGDLDGLARAGRMDGPEFATASARLDEHLTRGVREGFISPETRRVTLDSVHSRTGGLALFRAALDRLDGGETPDQMMREFERQADERGLDPGARHSFRSMLRTVVGEHQARQAHMRSELRADLEDWESVSAAGVAPFDPAVGVRLAERAEAAGDTTLAARIRRRQQSFIELSGTRIASLPDIIERQRATEEEMRSAGSQEERAAAYDRLRVLRDAARHRSEQMRTDPFGTASRVHAGKNGIGDIRPLDFSNAETMADQLTQRASAARLLGQMERIPDMPVLTAAEAEGLSRVIRDGNATQQLGIIRALRAVPADTRWRTLSALVPGEGRAQDHRVGTFIVATEMTERDPRVAVEMLNGLERMNIAPVPALQRAEVSAAITGYLAVPYRANAQARAAIEAAARALYTERASSGLDVSRPGTLSSPMLTTFDSALMSRILREIAPTVSWNGAAIPAPRRNGQVMTEAQVADAMATLPMHVLNGARAGSGALVTPDHIRRHGELVAIRDGQYRVLVSGFPVNQSDGRPLILDMRQDWPAAPGGRDFRNSLRQSESGQRAGITNAEGFAGLYQFGTERLAELTYYRPAAGEGRNGWRGTFHIPGFPEVRTLQDFLRTPAAQEAVAEVHFADIDDAIARLGPAASALDRNGLRAVAHLGGVQGMRRYVQTNGQYDPADSNGTRLSTYYRRFSGGGGYQQRADAQ